MHRLVSLPSASPHCWLEYKLDLQAHYRRQKAMCGENDEGERFVLLVLYLTNQ